MRPNRVLIPEAVHLPAERAERRHFVLRVAHALWKYQEQWNRKIEDYLLQEYLPLKNECWRQENEAELSLAQFKALISLDLICLSQDGSFDFCYGAGDLFSGRSIQICGNLADGPTGSNLMG